MFYRFSLGKLLHKHTKPMPAQEGRFRIQSYHNIFSKMSSTQEKIARHAKKPDSVTPYSGEKKSIETALRIPRC